jgi:hypothetical protein
MDFFRLQANYSPLVTMTSLAALRVLSEKFLEQSVIALNYDNAKDGSLMGDAFQVSGMDMKGTSGTWWICVIVAVIVLMLVVCCGAGVYRHKKKLQQEQQGSDSLDEPLFVDDPSIA